MTLYDTQPETERTSARQTLTDRAVLAGERLLEAGSTVGNAYADACEEAMLGMADFRKKIADARPDAWPKVSRSRARATKRDTKQLLASTKRLGASYLDAYERAVLDAVALQEEAATATGNRWLSSIGTMRAGIARDVTKSYADHARRLLA
jgi:hypothetical protein